MMDKNKGCDKRISVLEEKSKGIWSPSDYHSHYEYRTYLSPADVSYLFSILKEKDGETKALGFSLERQIKHSGQLVKSKDKAEAEKELYKEQLEDTKKVLREAMIILNSTLKGIT